MAPDVTSLFRDCLRCAKYRVCLRRQAISLKLFPTFKSLDSVTSDIPGPLFQSLQGLQHIFVIMERVTGLVQVVPLRRIRSMDVAQVDWNFGFTSMDCKRRYPQPMEGSLHLNYFHVYVRCSKLLMCSPLYATLSSIGR